MAGTLELIQALPAELREKICTEYIIIRLWQRKMLGWAEVHKELEKNPFCERRESFVKAMYCVDHLDCGVDGICVPCMRKSNINHYVFSDMLEYNCFRRCVEICEDELEHKWIHCKVKGLDPMREIMREFY